LKRVFASAIALFSLFACGSGERSGPQRQGGEGTSCLTTNDCRSPLECFSNTCAYPLDSAVGSDAAPATDVESWRRDDTFFDSDLLAVDIGSSADGPLGEDVFTQDDAESAPSEDAAEWPDALPEGPSDVLNPIGDCEELGIAANWTGTFTGNIDYDLGQPIPGLIEKDILPVDGSLSFSIQCIEAKLVVLGEMDGVALGLNPFTLTLQGTYSPSTGQLDAQMVDGVVTILGLVEVYFEGDFNGQLLTDTEFSGIWDGDAVGNNVDLNAVAVGTGDWSAAPSDEQ
jgi:hypothetical protein